MKYRSLLAGLIGAVITVTASASLVYRDNILITGQGFGTAPRDLTVDVNGRGSTESGCVGVNASGAGVIGPLAPGCGLDAMIPPGNGITPTGGNEAPPLEISGPKFGTPSLSSLGITDASQIAILFNAIEPNGGSITVSDITLNFFTLSGGIYTLTTSVDGSAEFTSTVPGNGGAGFVFVIDGEQQALVNTAIFQTGGFGSTLLSLNATLENAQAGADSFLIFNLSGPGGEPCVPGNGVVCGPQEIPEPGSLALLGIALLGGLAVTRRRGVAGTRD